MWRIVLLNVSRVFVSIACNSYCVRLVYSGGQDGLGRCSGAKDTGRNSFDVKQMRGWLGFEVQSGIEDSRSLAAQGLLSVHVSLDAIEVVLHT